MTDRAQFKFRKSSLSLAISSLLAAGAVQAAVITVDTNADGPVGSTPGCTLRSAIASANAGSSFDDCDPGSAGPDQIEFDSGLAFSTITLSEGEIAISDSLTITGPVEDDPDGIVVDGNDASRLFDVTGDSPGAFEVRLERLTLTGGRTIADLSPGGAIRAENADIGLEYSLVTGNSTQGNGSRGGGVSVYFGQGIVSHSIISGNTTLDDNAFGGGIHVRDGDLLLTSSTVSGNSTSGTAAWGIGVNVFGGSAIVTYSTISGNTGSGSYARGAGIRVQGGDVVMTGSTVADNSSPNSFSYGGGVYVVFGDAILENSTISGNTSGASGGGVYVPEGNIVLTNTTVTDNVATMGADGIHLGIFPSSNTLILNNSLIVQAESGETACNEEADMAANTLVTDTSCTGTATERADLALGPLEANGGATETHAIGPASVARDAAGNCLADFGILTDQRGEPRPGFLSSACDIGAFEYQDPDGLFKDGFESG